MSRTIGPVHPSQRFAPTGGVASGRGAFGHSSPVVSGAPGFGERGLWGEHAIQEAANGRAFARGREEWTAVRVNLHLATQVDVMIEEAAAYTRAPCGAGSPSSC